MKNENVHRIRKHAITLSFRDEGEAASWNRYASEFHHNQMLPALNKLFDEIAPSDTMIRIDKLEIDLGSVALPDLMPLLVERLKEQLEAAADNIVNKNDQQVFQENSNSISQPHHFFTQNKADRSPGNIPLARPGQFTRLPENSSPIIPAEDQIHHRESIRKASQLALENVHDAPWISAFLYFLKQGVLPWNSPVTHIPELESKLNAIPARNMESHRTQFHQVLIRQSVRQRLFQQFSFAFRNQLLSTVFEAELNQLNHILEEAQRLVLYLNANGFVAQDLHGNPAGYSPAQWLARNASSDSSLWPEEFSFFLLEKIRRVNHPVPASLVKPLHAWVVLRRSDLPGDQAASVFLNCTEQWSAAASPASTARRTIAASNQTLPKKENPDIPQAATGKASDEPPTQPLPPAVLTNSRELSGVVHIPSDRQNAALGGASADEVQDYYYLTYAGVILTWAYLPVLFRKLGYLHGYQFKTKKAQQRAVHLLGYAANGRIRNGEPDLLIAKILCGLGPGSVVSGRTRLKEGEQEEVNVMLKNLVSNWSILKNTSVEGLQSSFFARDGKLIREENRWKLIVEQKSFDMVLEHLPYPVSLIKLPWMQDVLNVDWM